MAHLLIVGGAGYVGSHCAKAVAAAGHTCVVLDNLSNGHRDFVKWGPLVEADLRDGAALDALLARERFDAVMHFAALAYVGESVTDPARYYDVNIGGTRMLLDAMRRAGVRHIVFSSTCAIYGEPECSPIAETSPPRPINPYGFTKFACERMIDDYARAYGLTSAKLRYFNAAGATPSGGIGEDHNPETHLIPLTLDVALGRRAGLCVFGADYPTPDGSCVRDYVHVDDLADAHQRSVARLLGGGESLAVNLGTGAGVSVLGIVARAREITGRTIPVSTAPRRAGDPAQLVAAPGRARELLGWTPTRSDPTTILKDAWRWHQARFGAPAG